MLEQSENGTVEYFKIVEVQGEWNHHSWMRRIGGVGAVIGLTRLFFRDEVFSAERGTFDYIDSEDISCRDSFNYHRDGDLLMVPYFDSEDDDQVILQIMDDEEVFLAKMKGKII